MKKILFVEDDKFLVRIYKVKLEEIGYEVKIIEDGDAIQSVLQTWFPDLIVLDMVMPIKDGFQVLKELRNDEMTRDIPVLTLTQLQMDSDIELMKKLGANHYMNKREATYKDVIEKINTLFE